MPVRIVLLVLVALNVAAAIWLLLAPDPVKPEPRQPTDPGVPVLRLLSEQLAEQQGESAELSAAPEPLPLPTPEEHAANAVCTEIGPFASQSVTRQAASALAEAGKIVANRTSVERRSRGYWVHLPPSASREQALSVARELSSAGVRDYYVVTAGDNENTVSLGLFRDRANAERRQREISSHGYPAQLSNREEEQAVYWLTVAHPGPGPIDWQQLVAAPNELRATGVACPD